MNIVWKKYNLWINAGIFLAIILPWPILLFTKLAHASGQTDTIAFWKREFISP